MKRYLLIAFLLVAAASPEKIRMLYNSLRLDSVPQHLAFYELYPHTSEGQSALRDAWKLLSKQNASSQTPLPALPLSSIQNLVSMVNKSPDFETPLLSDEELNAIDTLAQNLPNRKLKGRSVQSEAEALALPTEEIDLGRALFLTQFEGPDALRHVRSYEAMVDLMALQILVKLSPQADIKEKIYAINQYVFNEMRFRFPPHSLYAKDIDVYTFLPSVLDSRKGVCLGVSILYICLAQRLDLPLEMVTPPGHIYVRSRVGDEVINIETTARGIHMDSDVYLSVDTRKLQERTVKEVVGLAYFNQAAVYWHKKDHLKALECYNKALPYIPNDMLLKQLMAYNYLFSGDETTGRKLLQEVRDHVPDYAVSGDTTASDYLDGKIDVAGLKAVMSPVDETRESILAKKEEIAEILRKYPQFKAGVFNMGVAWLQLHRIGEALECLNAYHEMDPNDPNAEYFLTILNLERLNYNKAWEHFANVERLTAERDHHPKALKELRKALSKLSPKF